MAFRNIFTVIWISDIQYIDREDRNYGRASTIHQPSFPWCFTRPIIAPKLREHCRNNVPGLYRCYGVFLDEVDIGFGT